MQWLKRLIPSYSKSIIQFHIKSLALPYKITVQYSRYKQGQNLGSSNSLSLTVMVSLMYMYLRHSQSPILCLMTSSLQLINEQMLQFKLLKPCALYKRELVAFALVTVVLELKW